MGFAAKVIDGVGILRNPRTRTVRALLGSETKLRLSAADREFLRDLARVDLIDSSTADDTHYKHLKTRSNRALERLERAGVLRSFYVRSADEQVRVYTFANERIARAWGGGYPLPEPSVPSFTSFLPAVFTFILNVRPTFALRRVLRQMILLPAGGSHLMRYIQLQTARLFWLRLTLVNTRVRRLRTNKGGGRGCVRFGGSRRARRQKCPYQTMSLFTAYRGIYAC
ncbi:hypothetical protein CAL65_22315 [Alkalilimnicola ehrlichii]|uniref:Uncharacterized protein n=1 Tax=Alkalilimnicola ehrlichii TaxID=351052 RepID=A0A3E0WHC9_9GAMM|nr:hypothetical protein CAL65_22315 [Alkalilimnicola ehrlichii]